MHPAGERDIYLKYCKRYGGEQCRSGDSFAGDGLAACDRSATASTINASAHRRSPTGSKTLHPADEYVPLSIAHAASSVKRIFFWYCYPTLLINRFIDF